MKNLFLGVILIVLPSVLFAQGRSIQGQILDDQKFPIPGAGVFIDNQLRAVSDDKGKFTLQVRSAQAIDLTVRMLGFFESTQVLNSDSVSKEITVVLTRKSFLQKGVEVVATRAGKDTPMTYQNLDSEDLAEFNTGVDLPIMLNLTPSVVTTSDAGAGIGYTGMRIRGSDGTRINVTVNGIPINDSESHGVFWVNMPDLASSVSSLQIQRGVGTSSNGAGAFGASLNINTSDFDTTRQVRVSNNFGSFNSRRHNVQFNSGLLNNHFIFNARLSRISSDGYVDRAGSELRSYFTEGGYYRENWFVKATVFGGNEITQQAWYGTPQSRIEGDESQMRAHASREGYTDAQLENLLNSGRTYNYYTYDNEVDNYTQNHYQLHGSFNLSTRLKLSISGHYTRGFGYFEQFRDDDSWGDYGLEPPVIGTDTITTSDVIRRRWLDNDFYGTVYAFTWESNRFNATIGGSANEYVGDHFGEIIWSENPSGVESEYRYYDSEGRKRDFSNYAKANYRLPGGFGVYADVQARLIDYNTQGVDNDQRPISVDTSFLFFNPKAGVTWEGRGGSSAYFSVARASREPVRSDFIDAPAGAVPRPEFLTDFEAGWQYANAKLSVASSAFYMLYRDQLVVTGNVNDVGAPIRTNVDRSYRAGVELSGAWQALSWVRLEGNLSLSQNKIESFDEIIIDYTNGFEIVSVPHSNTDIAFSPSVVGAANLIFTPIEGFDIALRSKYVGKQYLDNTSNEDRSIDPFFVQDVFFSYTSKRWFRELELNLALNNVLNELYASNGYTYSYRFGETVTENFYYPQATFNFMAGVAVSF